jgi:hypothetical protein
MDGAMQLHHGVASNLQEVLRGNTQVSKCGAYFWALRGSFVLAAVLLIGGLVGCGHLEYAPATAPGWVREATTTTPAPRADIERTQAWRDAEALAALDADRYTVLGGGASMRPVYGEDTILVLQKVPFAELRLGMTAAYRNQAGRVVVHRLIRAEASGWVAEGLNNATADRERVTAQNLLGIVYAVFAHDGVR